MLTISESARDRIAALIASKDEPGLALRVAVVGRRFGRFVYDLALVGPTDRADGDIVIQSEPFGLLVDGASAEQLAGAKLDYITTDTISGFSVENPNPVWTDPSAVAVQQLIDDEINSMLGAHGGMVSLVEVKDGVAYLAFGGGCQGCGMVDVTLREGIEVRIKETVPSITAVVDTTDHSQRPGPLLASTAADE